MKDLALRENLKKWRISCKYNAKRPSKVVAIMQYVRQKKLYLYAGVAPNSIVNITKHCRFRLLNMLFSDRNLLELETDLLAHSLMKEKSEIIRISGRTSQLVGKTKTILILPSLL